MASLDATRRPPFRMRIRDLVAGKTVAEKYGNTREVTNYIASVWALKYRRGLDEWNIQVWSDDLRIRWRDLSHHERKAMQALIQSRFGGC